MDVKIIPGEKCKRYIEVTVPAAEVEPKVDGALRQHQKRIQLDGFRKGKAPLQLIRQIYGNAVREETIGDLMKEIVSEVREKNALEVVGPVNLEEKKYDQKDGLWFRVAVEVAPEIELRNYRGLEFERVIYDVEEQDVVEALEGLRDRFAKMQIVDGAVQAGHYVKVDLQKVDAAGFTIIGDKYENQQLYVTAEDEFTSPLIGAQVGDSRRISFTERRSDTTTGQNTTFYQATIKEITEKILPPLDDTFARELGDAGMRTSSRDKKVETLEELKKVIHEELLSRAARRSQENLHNEIIDELIKVNPFDLPEEMAASYAQEFTEKVKSQFVGMSEEMVKKEAHDMAFRHLRWEFLRNRIAEAERIEVNDEELREYLVSLALSSNQDPQRLINQTMNNEERREKLRDELHEKKVLQFLEGQMRIREHHIPYADRGQSRIIRV